MDNAGEVIGGQGVRYLQRIRVFFWKKRVLSHHLSHHFGEVSKRF